jgi:hypothetical protein
LKSASKTLPKRKAVPIQSEAALSFDLAKRHNKKKTTIEDRISLPESITNNISSWVKNPLEFFCDADDHIIKLNLSSFYRTLLHLDRRRYNDLIRSRFLKVIFHRLRQSLGIQRLHSHSVDNIARIISTAGLVKDSLDEIKNHINGWVKRVRRWTLYVKTSIKEMGLGIGIFVCCFACLVM